MFTECELVSQMAALALLLEVTWAVLEGVDPHKSDGPDGVHPSLTRILVSVHAVPTAECHNRTNVAVRQANSRG